MFRVWQDKHTGCFVFPSCTFACFVLAKHPGWIKLWQCDVRWGESLTVHVCLKKGKLQHLFSCLCVGWCRFFLGGGQTGRSAKMTGNCTNFTPKTKFGLKNPPKFVYTCIFQILTVFFPFGKFTKPDPYFSEFGAKKLGQNGRQGTYLNASSWHHGLLVFQCLCGKDWLCINDFDRPWSS